MIFEVRNLGNLKEARVDLSKNLIVFTGQNNTGKTYLSYAIHGLFSFRPKEIYRNSFLMSAKNELYEKGETELNISILANDANFIHLLISEFKTKLPEYFGISESFFLETNFSLIFTEEYVKKLTTFGSFFHVNQPTATFKKRRGENIAYFTFDNTLTLTEEAKELTITQLFDLAVQMLIRGNQLELDFFPIERVGISVFSKDIYNSRFSLTNTLINTTFQNPDGAANDIKKRINPYPLAINNSIQTEENRLRFQANNSLQFSDLALELEAKVLGGELLVKEQGSMVLIVNNKEIPVQLAGSTVKSLSSFTFYLKHMAYNGAKIVFDEPEINLHPDNQIIVARILAQIVNRGIRVLLSTHSDYILREINNLLLLGSHRNNKSANELIERYGYKNEQILDSSSVGAYIFHKNDDLTASFSEIIIDPIDGIQTDTINKVINQQNQIANALYNRLITENSENV